MLFPYFPMKNLVPNLFDLLRYTIVDTSEGAVLLHLNSETAGIEESTNQGQPQKSSKVKMVCLRTVNHGRVVPRCP